MSFKGVFSLNYDGKQNKTKTEKSCVLRYCCYVRATKNIIRQSKRKRKSKSSRRDRTRHDMHDIMMGPVKNGTVDNEDILTPHACTKISLRPFTVYTPSSLPHPPAPWLGPGPLALSPAVPPIQLGACKWPPNVG